MNYIKQLQEKIAQHEAYIESLESSFNAFHAYLNSPKFNGVDLDGSRKDWIATSDVCNWLRETRSQALLASNN